MRPFTLAHMSVASSDFSGMCQSASQPAGSLLSSSVSLFIYLSATPVPNVFLHTSLVEFFDRCSVSDFYIPQKLSLLHETASCTAKDFSECCRRQKMSLRFSFLSAYKTSRVRAASQFVLNTACGPRNSPQMHQIYTTYPQIILQKSIQSRFKFSKQDFVLNVSFFDYLKRSKK